ncbi:MAG: nitronate monooxygenase [Woeseiaceae bacterium]
MDTRERIASLRMPLFAAPMFLISGPDLVVEACKAGIIGAFPTPNCRTTEDLEKWFADIDSRLCNPDDPNAVNYAPYAANLVVHSTNTRLPEDLEIVMRYKAPIVITALGSPGRVVEAVHSYGGLVFADVNNVEYARKAAATGADGLVLVCSGAGGHTGALNPFSFVHEVRKFWDGYIALAGGISNGAAALASIVAGADFAYMGTSFIATDESLAEPEYKQMLVDCTAEDLIVTKAFTGANASMMKPSIVNQGLNPDEIANSTAKMNFSGQDGAEVKPWKGIWAAGQGVGCIDEIQPLAKLVDKLEAEYQRARAMIR